MSWEFRDSSHGDGLTEGLDGVRRWVRLGIVVTTLLELFGLEEEEEGPDLPSLRVHTPLYRRGSGYRLGGRLPGCRLLRGCVFGVILWPLTPYLTVATL
jgi:hypothetical protein